MYIVYIYIYMYIHIHTYTYQDPTNQDPLSLNSENTALRN